MCSTQLASHHVRNDYMCSAKEELCFTILAYITVSKSLYSGAEEALDGSKQGVFDHF